MMTIQVPKIESLFELGQMLDADREDFEFWRWVVVASANDICISRDLNSFNCGELTQLRLAFDDLRRRRLVDWNGIPERFVEADKAVCGEINQFLNRVFTFDTFNHGQGDEMAPAATGKRKTVEQKETKGAKFKRLDSTQAVLDKIVADKAKKTKPTAVEAAKNSADFLSSIEIVETRDVEYSSIVRSPHNPRKTFDETLIAQMRPSIVAICAMQPLTVREGTLEIIDGETRHRAGEGVAKELRCNIVRCTDAQAAEIRLKTSEDRRPLNPIDKAMALQAMIDQHGYTHRQLAKLVTGSVGNLVGLLKLPEAWKQRVISGEISGTAARHLIPWCDEPRVLADIARGMKVLDGEERSLALPELVEQAIHHESRPLRGYYWDGDRNKSYNVEIQPTDEQLELLRIRTVPINGEEVERAFNVDLWDQLLGESEERRVALMEGRDADLSTDGQPDPKKVAENAKKQAEQLQKRLYRYKCQWLRSQLAGVVQSSNLADLLRWALWFATRQVDIFERAEQFAHRLTDRPTHKRELVDVMKSLFNGTGDKELLKEARELLALWVLGDFEKWDSPLTPELIEVAAANADINIAAQWPIECQRTESTSLECYLDLLTSSQLVDLVAEWKLSVVVVNRKRAELLEDIKAVGNGKPLPKALATVKPCKLC